MNVLPGVSDSRALKAKGLTSLSSLHADTPATMPGRLKRGSVRLGSPRARRLESGGDDPSGLVPSTQGLRRLTGRKGVNQTNA